MNKKIFVTAVTALFLFGAAAVLLADSGTAEDDTAVPIGDPVDPYFTIKNSIGTTVTFSEPAQKAASLGLSFSTTLLELGCLDDIVMIDNYSATSSSGVAEFGSIYPYPVGDGQAIAQLLANGLGGFNKNRDVVFLYGYSYHATAIQSMETLGLKVVTFYPQSYEAGKNMVTDIGKIMGVSAKAKEITDSMDSALTYYSDKLADYGITETQKVKAAYVSYSGGIIRVGNINSYSVILMKIAGGANAADNASLTGSSLTSYQVDSSFFIQTDLDVIFLDPYYTGTPGSFREEMNIGSEVRIYKLSMVMNQYGPTSLDGIEYMAMAMYPYIFGPVENDDNTVDNGNTMLYVAAGGAAVAAIAVAYVVVSKP